MKKILSFMLMLCSLFILVGCMTEYVRVEKPNDIPIDHPKEEGQQASYLMDKLNLLGIASVKEFKTNTHPLKAKHFNSNISQDKELSEEAPTVIESLTYTYPYDYVKIHSAWKFSITIPEDEEDEGLEMIQSSCGLGDLDVILADFSTFVLDKEKNELRLSVQDMMITLVGKKGLYTILMNSGFYQYHTGEAHSSVIYSSHKTIDSEGINKDFLPPFYGINVKYGYDGAYDVSFTKKGNLATADDFILSTKYKYDYTKIERVARDTMYNVLDLTTSPQEWMEGDIYLINPDKNVLTLRIAEDTFVDVYLSKNTMLKNNLIDIDSIWEILETETRIAVRYDYWYNGY
nr:hypothetical protein [Anaeroplasmataceae bacterium]